MSLQELEARAAAVASELDETMAQTFRARGAKLVALTARLEELEQESKRLEAAIASAKAGGGGGGAPPSPAAAFSAPVASSVPSHVAPEGYGRPSPAMQRPGYAATANAPPVVASPVISRPVYADPYAAVAQHRPAADPYASVGFAAQPQPQQPMVNPYSASVVPASPYGTSSPMPQRPPPVSSGYGTTSAGVAPYGTSSPMPQRPPPAPAPSTVVGGPEVQKLQFFNKLNQDLAAQQQQQLSASPLPQRRPPPPPPPQSEEQAPPVRDTKQLKQERKAALLAKKNELMERLNAATVGIKQLQQVRAFLDKKVERLAAKAKDVAEQEGFVHYVLNQEQVIKSQRIIRKWLKRRRDPNASRASDMLLKAVKDYRESDVAKDAKHRWQALVEIYNTEKSYHASLELLIKYYARPIEAASQLPNSCVEPVQSVMIFNTLDAIAGHSSKMVERLAYATVSIKKSEKMGDVFLQMIPTMALYERYYIGFEDSQTTLKKLYKDKRFAELVAQCKKASGVQLTLEQLLIMPVQRLPRYAILLDALLKHTPATHSDRASLVEALDKVKQVLSGINAKTKEHETVGAVVRIAEKVQLLPAGFQLATANRRFVRSDLLIYVVAGRIVTRKKPVFCFLFNDVLMRTKQKRGAEDEYLFRELIPLDASTQLQVLPDDKTVTNGFTLSRGEKHWKFMLDSSGKRDSWMDSLNDVLQPPPPPAAAAAAAPVAAAAPASAAPAPAVALKAVAAAAAAKGGKGPALVSPSPSAPPSSSQPSASPRPSSVTPQPPPSSSAVQLWDSSPPPPLLPWPADVDVCAPPPLFVAIKGNTTEFGGESSVVDVSEVFEAHLRTPYYEKFLRFRPHSFFLGTLAGGKPFVLVVERTPTTAKGSLFAMVLNAAGTGDVRFTFSSAKTLEGELKKRGFDVHLKSLTRVTSDGPGADRLVDKMCKFESSRIINCYKFGVMYWKDGQSEDEAFANQLSPAFESFLDKLGTRIKLKGWSKYRGGLNVQNNETGEESVYCEFNGFEVMFHVAPLLPFNQADKQQLERKRHLGNDVVMVVFRERGDVPFDVSQFHSQFNHVFVVVTPLGARGYRIGVMCKPGVPFFGPRIPHGGVFAQSDAGLHDWLLAKLINGERAAMHAKDFAGKALKTQTAQLHDLVDFAAEPLPPAAAAVAAAPAAGGKGAVNPDDPRELQRRLSELKAHAATTAASLDGLRKLSSFYNKDPKAKAESDAKIHELERDQKVLNAQVEAIEGKMRDMAAATVSKITLSGKTDAEKQSLMESFKGQIVQQEKTVASLEKLLGFYAKDPSGAASTKVQLEKEKEVLKALQTRVAELRNSLTGSSSANTMSSVSASEEEEDEDEFDVDALSTALRGVDQLHPVAGAGGVNVDALTRALQAGAAGARQQATTVAAKGDGNEEEEGEVNPERLQNLRSTLKATLIDLDKEEEEDGEDTDVAGTMVRDHESFKAGDRVWILSESPDWTYVSGEGGEMYVPSSAVQKDQ